jgi:hypothetical protein
MHDVLLWLLFFFIAFGAKFVLAMATIYFIFPAERTCSECDADTLPVRMGLAGRAAAKLMGGRIQRRWCPRCGWEGMTRTVPVPESELLPFADERPVRN